MQYIRITTYINNIIIMEGHILLNKYAPKDICEFLGSQNAIREFSSFLQRENNDRAVILLGPSGSGKTTFIKLLLAKYSISNVLYVDQTTTHKEFEQQIYDFIRTKTLCDILGFGNNTKVLIIDDIEMMIATDRYVISFILDLVKFLNNPKNADDTKNIKLVITACISEEKKLTDLKKYLSIIKIQNPEYEDTFNYITSILDKEGYEYDTELISKMINIFNRNIRNIFLNLFSDLDLDQEETERNFFDLNIFEIVEKLFDTNANLETALNYDPSLISFMMYDNMTNVFVSRYDINDKHAFFDKFDMIRKSYIDSSLIEDNAYKINDWTMVECSNLVKCGTIRYTQNVFKDKKKPPHTIQPLKISYTQIPTRAAQHYSYLKRLKNHLTFSHKTFENFMFETEIYHVNSNILTTSSKKDEDEHLLRNAYKNNICSKTYRIYKPIIICHEH